MSTAGAQAVTEPPSPTKMNAAAPDFPACVTLKSVALPLNTMPVGLAGPEAVAGMLTTSDCTTPLPS
ncbi:hypothetical protein AWB68_07251 [Caballeronia choica]|uniref:Uncharacterized protein n=1 Tax=Caballeronia choica TaxID=326476 RepID=A0A158KT62_9BURK|nr:hypothetical protein AWB68_07251 [Caballeronia choica]